MALPVMVVADPRPVTGMNPKVPVATRPLAPRSSKLHWVRRIFSVTRKD